MEGIDTNLDNASIVHCLGVEVAFLDNLRDVTHNQKLFSLLSLINCVVEDNVQDGLRDMGVVLGFQNGLTILLQHLFIGKFSESQFYI